MEDTLQKSMVSYSNTLKKQEKLSDKNPKYKKFFDILCNKVDNKIKEIDKNLAQILDFHKKLMESF